MITKEKATISYGDLCSLIYILAEKAADYTGLCYEDFMEEGYLSRFLDYLESEPPNKTITLTESSFEKMC